MRRSSRGCALPPAAPPLLPPPPRRPPRRSARTTRSSRVHCAARRMPRLLRSRAPRRLLRSVVAALRRPPAASPSRRWLQSKPSPTLTAASRWSLRLTRNCGGYLALRRSARKSRPSAAGSSKAQKRLRCVARLGLPLRCSRRLRATPGAAARSNRKRAFCYPQVTFTGRLFAPAPWTPTTKLGMPAVRATPLPPLQKRTPLQR